MPVKADVITSLPSIPGNWHKSVVEGIPQKISKHKLHNVLIRINLAPATYSYLSDFRYFPLSSLLALLSQTKAVQLQRERHIWERDRDLFTNHLYDTKHFPQGLVKPFTFSPCLPLTTSNQFPTESYMWRCFTLWTVCCARPEGCGKAIWSHFLTPTTSMPVQLMRWNKQPWEVRGKWK